MLKCFLHLRGNWIVTLPPLCLLSITEKSRITLCVHHNKFSTENWTSCLSFPSDLCTFLFPSKCYSECRLPLLSLCVFRQPFSQEYILLLHLLFVCLSILSLLVLLPSRYTVKSHIAPGLILLST